MGRYSEETKLAVVEDYCSGTAVLKVVARRHDVNVASAHAARKADLAFRPGLAISDGGVPAPSRESFDHTMHVAQAHLL